MNYLAHLFLADHSTESLIGNLLGDFVKGRLSNQYSETIIHGIALHRKIDSYTDAHWITRASRNLISPERRRFAGIITDIGYDHFLSRHWHRYTDIELSSFISAVYRILQHNASTLPERLQRLLPRMVDENWLGSYQHLSGIECALNRVSERFKRKNPLLGSVVEIERHYDQLERHFLVFFPQVIRFAKHHHSAPCPTAENEQAETQPPSQPFEEAHGMN